MGKSEDLRNIETTWTQIFSHLHPQDLLRISWTTKAFRRVLTSTSSKTVWMDSFAAVAGLPDCPEDMNEVEYASLLFNPLCQVLINNPSKFYVFRILNFPISS